MKTSKALVFDIKRFAVHDGAGIRTTVFFKGCPLRCKWCQNPEGLTINRRPLYFKSSCIHCRRCEQAAKKGQIVYKDDRPWFNLTFEDFDSVIKACPSGAIRYDSTWYDVETLVDKIKEDMVFFRHGGGVTFSGGEPLMQKDFLVEILKRCQQEGIHTAMETTVYAPLDLVKRVMENLDQVYIDCKLFDSKLHKQSTGVENEQILKNIQWVLQSKHKDKVIIRTPLIPGYTATKDNLASIAEYISGIYPKVSYELLNYNPLAESKYELVEKEYPLGKQKMFTKEEMNHFYKVVQTHGIEHLIKG